ncbi:hypothetical protein VD0002_g3575 [Verticillium dahliae]|uniref:Glycoside hydrolase family 43 protein n=2 Tax=Verticillium dahliae TaxID=27337 RepID=G2XJS2_VERDV|nr:uncharacterized protein VDAG_10404 [Verticillium dahliae VdLs.17]KAF3351661.1 Ferric reductase transmembrane component 3 [Verticillium dahliae VDG2]KAH6708068.1 hypothetical protein EV126DRAFT_104053 [Verticillium dahliae]EGY20775.1 hypothetical protein VDAG_10404 [Verticillium dahliae VdLs.17]PNH27046.1 hypothetical protein BJF96_g9647 [Verticillium dahliae]PNH52725.1 hypothetical protein VD0003_g4613 [Verticillium dahliae]
MPFFAPGWPAAVVSVLAASALGQGTNFPPDTLGLENGLIEIDRPNLSARIVRDAQVLASLRVAGESFDFLPFDYLDRRNRDGQYHWGDITYRYREEGSTAWIDGDSAKKRQPVESLSPGDALAASGLGPTLPSSPLNITREWLEVDGDLGLRFTIVNTGDATLELGSLGFPAEFNSIFTHREPLEMQKSCSLSDPYIGLDAGQIRVTPVNPVRGSRAALVVTPLGGTSTPLEAYRNLVEPSFQDTGYGSQTFEGFYEWQVLSQAWAEKEWAAAEQGPWNNPSSRALESGEALQFGVRFTVATDGVRGFDDAVRKTGTPTALGVPGYLLARDLPGQLFINASSAISSFSSEPAGALSVAENNNGGYTVTPSSAESTWGRVRLTVKYADGKVQTIHYFITKPTSEALADMGRFLFNEAWFTDESDPFNRTPSVMTYDYEAGAIVEQDSRAWVAGLSDEGGTGAYVAAAMKQVLQPDAEEVAKLDEFVNKVVWGQIQLEDYSVRKSIFYYDPDRVDYNYSSNIDWTSWTSWNRENSYFIDRAYNYVHPAAAYWVLYRVARAYPDLVNHDWPWYLEKAWGTAHRMTDSEIWYNDMGLMGETVFGFILQDLFREGETRKAEQLEARMRERAQLWDSQDVPYGSEMAWDSTGQEGVYYWTKHFGFDGSAAQTVDSVLGYMPTVPHWGWNGCARRYWDFIYGGKLRRIERQIHHYGSGLNAQVLLAAFRDDPSDSYLVRVGYAGSSAPVSNINQDGFPSVAYHAWPDTQKWDGITGDYGGGFLGMALSGGVYVADDSEVGLVAYGGILSRQASSVTVQPKDAVKRRVYIGPLSILVEIDAGMVKEFSYDGESVTLNVKQPADGPRADSVIVWIDSRSEKQWGVISNGAVEARGGWQIGFGDDGATIKLGSV